MTAAAPAAREPAAPQPATVDPLVTETADRLFGELCTHEAVQQAETDAWAPQIWEAFTETGFHTVSVHENAGGSGGTLADALEMLRLAGYHAAPIPAAEHGVLAGWLVAGAGIDLPDGLTTVVPAVSAGACTLTTGADRSGADGTSTGKLTGAAVRVPWARHADRIVCLCHSSDDVSGDSGEDSDSAVDAATAAFVAVVAASDCEIVPMTNLAGEPRDTVVFADADALVAPAAPGVDAAALTARGALSRAALMAGAIEKMSQLTVSYTNERVQFGRPVARFQAVQRHLVSAAQDAALVRMAAESAARAAARGDARFEIAAAKLVANQAAARATKACHQAHGAMGMTQEYPLHHFSRRLWSWRKEYGDDAYWTKLLGVMAVGVGADGLYGLITGGTAALAPPDAP